MLITFLENNLEADGSADATYRYSDYGETTVSGDDKARNEICYTGGVYDDTTGFYYLNARYVLIDNRKMNIYKDVYDFRHD